MSDAELKHQRAKGREAYRIRRDRQKAAKDEADRNSSELKQAKAELNKTKVKLVAARSQMDEAWEEADRIKAALKAVNCELKELKAEQYEERLQFEEALVDNEKYKAALSAARATIKELRLQAERFSVQAAKATRYSSSIYLWHRRLIVGKAWAKGRCPSETARNSGKEPSLF